MNGENVQGNGWTAECFYVELQYRAAAWRLEVECAWETTLAALVSMGRLDITALSVSLLPPATCAVIVKTFN